MSSTTIERTPDGDGNDERDEQPQALEEHAAQITTAPTVSGPCDPMDAVYTRATGADADIAVYIAHRFFDGQMRAVLVERHGYLCADDAGPTHERFYFEIDFTHNRAIRVPERATRAELLALRAQYGMSR